jgi:hypothetical protein
LCMWQSCSWLLGMFLRSICTKRCFRETSGRFCRSETIYTWENSILLQPKPTQPFPLEPAFFISCVLSQVRLTQRLL